MIIILHLRAVGANWSCKLVDIDWFVGYYSYYTMESSRALD